MEPHCLLSFIHWFPRSIGRYFVDISSWKQLARPSKSVADDYWDNANLLSATVLNDLMPDWTISYEKVFGFKKSHYVVKGLTTEKR